MKKWFNDKYTTIAIYAFLVLLAAFFFLLVLLNFPAILSTLYFLLFSARGVVIGVVIALILYPMAAGIERFLAPRLFRRKRHPHALRMISVLLTFLIVFICAAITVVSILPMMHQNYEDLQGRVTEYVESIVSLIQSNDIIYNFILAQTQLTGGTPSEIITEIVTLYSDMLSNFAGNIVAFLVSLITVTSDVLIALILSFYFLLSRGAVGIILRKIAIALLPAGFRREASRITTRFYTDVMEFLSARLLCSFILGILCYLLSWALGVRFYPIIALLVFVFNIIPVIGPIFAVLVGTLIVFVVQPQATWIFLVIILSLNLLEEHLVERLVLNRRLRLSPAAALICILIAYHYFGFGGTIFAVPVFVTLRSEVNLFLDRTLRRKGLSPNTADYLPANAPQMEEAAESIQKEA